MSVSFTFVVNARMGYTPVLGETAVRTMWNEYATTGKYTPTAGIVWYANQIIAYIKTTMS